jgi:hypothetical protein
MRRIKLLRPRPSGKKLASTTALLAPDIGQKPSPWDRRALIKQSPLIGAVAKRGLLHQGRSITTVAGARIALTMLVLAEGIARSKELALQI